MKFFAFKHSLIRPALFPRTRYYLSRSHFATGPVKASFEEATQNWTKKNQSEKLWRRRAIISVASIGFVLMLPGLRDVDHSVYTVAKSAFFLLDPEVAHKLTIELAKWNLFPINYDKDPPELRMEVCGLQFPNPIGLAAGFDKDAKAVLPLLKLGFGFVEVGSVTPLPQPGNLKKRIFRLEEDRAVINRCGFNSEGADAVRSSLQKVSQKRWKDQLTTHNIIGVNLGKNKTSADPIADIQAGIQKLAEFGDYVVLNLSSPNTPGLRDLQSKNNLRTLIQEEKKEINLLSKKLKAESSNSKEYQFPTQTGKVPPLFIKIAPDLTTEQKKDIAEVIISESVDGLIICNTTTSRPSTLKSPLKDEVGGLSGAPLKDLSTKCVSDFYTLTKGNVPIIACGGIETAQDALQKIEAGASLVQIYTGMIYGGPATAKNINRQLSRLLYKKGYPYLKSAVGASHRKKQALN